MNKTRQPIIQRYKLLLSLLVAFCGLCLIAARVSAGDLTTDNLTVNKDGGVYGNFQVFKTTIPTNNLILYYSFSTNTTPVPDDSGNGNTGTVYGATWTTNGITGGAYSFDGSDDKILSCNNVGITGNVSRTVAFWAKVTQGAGESPAVSFGSTASYGAFGIYIGGSAWSNFYMLHQPGGYDFNTVISATTDWRHYAVVFNGTTETKYLNGSFLDSADRHLLNTVDSVVTLGLAINPPDTSRLTGSLDEVRIYNRALSSTEISALYHSGLAPGTNSIRLEPGISYTAPLGDVSMGVYTNQP